MSNHKKLYYVSREVMATSITRAMKERGVVFSVILATEVAQPPLKKEPLGFNKDKK